MTHSVECRQMEILLVEDNPGDVHLTLEAFKEAAATHPHVSVVREGVEAMAFLRRQGKFANAPRPDLILLDLNLPRKDGREVLAEVKADPDLQRTPVVVLTTSRAEDDVQTAYELHANCYIPKPLSFDQFLEIVRSIESFWLVMVKLPHC